MKFSLRNFLNVFFTLKNRLMKSPKTFLKSLILILLIYVYAKNVIKYLGERYERMSFVVPLPLIITDEIPTADLSNKCDPVYQEQKNQYQVEIDGEMYPKYVPNYLNWSLNFKCLNSGRMKTILLWNTYFGSPYYYFGLGQRAPFVYNKCPVTSCELTNDKSRINNSHLVVVHLIDKVTELPKTRPANQRWV